MIKWIVLAGLVLLMLPTAPSLAQTTPNTCDPTQPDTCTYQSPTYYDAITTHEMTLENTDLHRTLTILIRYPEGASEPLPLLLWSHGAPPDTTGTRQRGSVAFSEAMAHAGYAVIHMGHVPVENPPLLCADYNLPTTICPTDSDNEVLMRAIRPRDIQFILDYVTEYADELPVALDLEHIGMAGHSFGAYTVMTLAGATTTFTVGEASQTVNFADPRIDAFVALSPQGPGRYGFADDSWAQILRPVMTITGAADDTGAEQSEDRLIPFQRMPIGDKYLLYIDNPRASHDLFNLGKDEPLVQVVNMGIVAFFDHTLRKLSVATAYLQSDNLAHLTSGIASIQSRLIQTEATNWTWSRSYDAPQTDAIGNRLTGTEIMHIEAYQGSVFAANGYWGETELPFIEQRAQILRLDEPAGTWQLDYQLPYRFTRAEAMEVVHFKTDSRGVALSVPVSLLVIGGHYPLLGDAEGIAAVAVRDPNGVWIPTILDTYTGDQDLVSIRAIGQYQDGVTGVSMVFVGVQPEPLGVYSGVYDPSVEGGIRWSTTPELQTGVNSERILGFATCNNKFYVSTSSRIYERIDGPNPTWQQILDVRNETFGTTYPARQSAAEDMRALTCVDNPSGEGDLLLFGWLTRLALFDPATKTVTLEADLLAVLSALLDQPVGYVQINEYDMLDDVGYIGLELIYQAELDAVADEPYRGEFSNAYYTKEALILTRRQTTDGISYGLISVSDPTAAEPEILIRVRDVLPSPFSSDQGNALYVGGFAPRRTSDTPDRAYTNTAWIYRGIGN